MITIMIIIITTIIMMMIIIIVIIIIIAITITKLKRDFVLTRRYHDKEINWFFIDNKTQT